MDLDADQKLDAFIDAYDGIGFVVDADGRCVEVMEGRGSAGDSLLYDDADELLGRRLQEVLPESDTDRFLDVLEEVLEGGRSAVVEYELGVKAGPRWFEATVTPLSTDEPSVLWVIRDVTERKEYERAVTELHDVADELARCTTREAVYRRAIEAARSLFDFDLSGIAIEEDGRLRMRAMSEEVPLKEMPTLDTNEGIAGKTYRRGESFLVEDIDDFEQAEPQTEIGSALSVPLGEYGIVQVIDERPGAFDERDLELLELLAEHVRVELDRLDRERELAEYETILETIPMGVFVLDDAGTIVTVTEFGARMAGYSTDELLGEPLENLVEAGVVDESAVDAYLDAVRELLSSETETTKEVIETEITTRDGDSRIVRAHVSLLPYHEEFEGTVQVYHDVTEQRRREEELQRQNERLERFASIVSHDLRNPLNVAAGHLELAEQECDSEHLSYVSDAHDRMEALLDDTLMLARHGRTVSETEPIRLDELSRQCWKMTRTNEATLEVCGEGTIPGDPDRVRQVFENLFRNAVEHGEPDVTIRVGLLDGGFYVEDDGPGIPEDERNRVFDLGFTTLEGGTGFGLTIVREIVEAHGWEISVSESADGGVRFEITGADVE